MRLPEVRKILSATSAMLGHPRPCAVGAPQDVDMVSIEDIMENLLPFRHGGDLGLVLVDLVPRQFAAVCVDVDLTRAQPALALSVVVAVFVGVVVGVCFVRLVVCLFF